VLRITLIVLLTLTVFGGFAEVVEDSTEESAPPRDTQLQDYIALHKGEFQGIYEDFLLTEPELAGRVVVEVTLRDGLAADAVVVENNTGSEELGEAIIAGFESWYVEGLSGDVTFVLPLVFQPSNGELATLEGRAFDHSGDPYEGATVTVSGVDFWAETDADGYYTISGIPAGSYYVYCMTADYLESEASDVVLEGNSVVTLDFTEFYMLELAEKPNIYLYPTEETKVDVFIDFPRGGRITVSDPDYGSGRSQGWHVTASPDGMLADEDGEYGFLFYESQNPLPETDRGSWVVEQPELEGFFRENLVAHGFVGREIEDFVEYWIPRLTDSPWYSLRPLYKEELAEVISLQIEPEPDSLLRLIYVIRGLDAVDGDPTPPVIPDFERTGFTVAEWGGIVEGEWFELEENGAISGTVTDEEGCPLELATIKVLGTSIFVTTDEDGYYQRTDIEPGTYDILCTVAGFKDMKYTDIVFEEGAVVSLDFTMVKPTEVERSGIILSPVYKPNIYLYPVEETDVSVSLSFPAGGEVTVSDPDYGDGWDVSIAPDGTISSEEGEHSFLFYESLNADLCQREQGWVVPREGLEEFFRQNLATTGFYEQEIEDFIEFWIHRPLNRPWYAVYPQYNAGYGEMVELSVDPAPHSLIRLVYLIAGLDEEIELMLAIIPAFESGGFTVHEWGVMLAEEMEEPLYGSIHGTVVDERGVPIELADIKVQGTRLWTRTDEDGYYTIENIPPATYDILCTVAGFENFEVTDVVIESGDRRTINFTLQKPENTTYTGKPNIYLYPVEETDVSIQLSFPAGGRVTVSDPDYGDGWNVTASPDGWLDTGVGYGVAPTDGGEVIFDAPRHRFLFYESMNADLCQREQGWLIPRTMLDPFFSQNLLAYGFNEQERRDFTDYWIPRLTASPWYLIYPQLNEDYGRMVALSVTPEPDSLLRLVYLIEPVESDTLPDGLTTPEIPTFERDGFTVTEWGVINDDLDALTSEGLLVY